MRRQNEHNDNKYYTYVSPQSLSPTRNASSGNITNQNAHYQYYDPRLRTRQHAQQALYEYQYSIGSPPNRRSPGTIYGSPRRQQPYQPPSFFQDLPPSSANSISDLGEPISVFDDIQPLEHRRSFIAPALPSTYIPPNPTRRQSLNDSRIATAQAFREQLLTDIQHSITDIDRELTSLERQTSVSRYIPPRFPPIAELDPHDNKSFQQKKNSFKPVSVPVKQVIPAITSPMSKPIQQTSAHSTATTTKESINGTSQIWPNKPKRIYQVIPNLANDSRKTSRQSSVGAKHEQTKISEILSPQSTPKLIEKSISSSSSKLQLRGQYHYAPEVDETEILPNDPEDVDHKSAIDEMEEKHQYETLNTDQFLRDLSPPPESHAIINVPQFSSNSELGARESIEDLIRHGEADTNNVTALSAESLIDLPSNTEVKVQDTESLAQVASPEVHIKSTIKSRDAITPHEIPLHTEIDAENQNNSVISVTNESLRPLTKASTAMPIASNDDVIEKSSSLLLPPIDSTGSISNPPITVDSNANGAVAYFFSDFSNEGEGEEDLLPIDQSNFVVSKDADVISEDTISNSLLAQSQASLANLHSAHVPQREQQQQEQEQQQKQKQHQQQPLPPQFTPTMLSTLKNHNEHRKVEENKEIESEKTNATMKGITTTASVLPASSPSQKKILPTSIIDDMQTQFSRESSARNSDHHQQSSTTVSNYEGVYSNIEEQEKPLTHSLIHRRESLSLRSKMNSRRQSATSEKHDERFKNKDEERSALLSRNHTPYKSINNEYIETSDRIDSTTRRLKSSSRSISRTMSRNSRNTKHDDVITPIDSATKSALSNTDRENSVISRTNSRPSSIAPSEQSRLSQRRSASRNPSVANDKLNELNTLNDYKMYGKINDNNEPNTFSVHSEHFLHHEPHASYDMNQRVPSNYSASHPNESRQNSAGSVGSAIPVALDSPDNQNEPPKTSRTATPKDNGSVCSMYTTYDPNAILTTTDDPDPNDPSIINSTIHLQIMSSHPLNAESSLSKRTEPSPLENIMPVEKLPSRVPSVALPSELLQPEEQLQRSSPSLHHTPIPTAELQRSHESSLASIENHSVLPATPLRKTSSPSKTEVEEQPPRQTPMLSYPARLEDLMRQTPSPPLLANQDQQNQNEYQHNENNRLSSLSTPINEMVTNGNVHAQQNSPNKIKQSNMPSYLSSPRRSVLSDTNHTSVEGDDTYRQQLDSPPIYPKNLRVVSHVNDYHMNNNQVGIQKHNDSIFSHEDRTAMNENQHYPSSERSTSPIQVQYQPSHDEHLYRNDVQLSSASIRLTKVPSPPSSASNTRPTSTDEDYPSMTPSQQHSKLSLRLRKQKLKRKKSTHDQLPAPPQIDTDDVSPMNNDDNIEEGKPKQRQRRRVSFSSSVAHFHIEERQLLTNWRERVAAILASKRHSKEKYAHVQSRVNSFANFEYQPKKIRIIPVKIIHPKVAEVNKPSTVEEKKLTKRKKFKGKKPKRQPIISTDEHTEDERPPVKEPAPQLFGRLWCLPDGSPTVFHESLDWNVASKLRSYSYENVNYEPARSEFKIFNKKPKWHSESKLADLIKEPPRFLRRQNLPIMNTLPVIPDRGEPYSYQQQSLESGTERKIFDIQTNTNQQFEGTFPNNFTENMSYRSYDSRASEIFNEKLSWTKKSKLKDTIWKNIKYQPKKSKVQIFNKTVHWNSESKVRTRSPSWVNPSQGPMSNVQIFDEKLNWDAQAKVHCWSEIDLRQLTKKRAIFAQYHDPKWNDIVTPRIDTNNYNYPKFANHVEIFSDRPTWNRNSELRDYVWENFDYKSRPRTRQSYNRQGGKDSDQENENMAYGASNAFVSQFRRVNSPANKPKWNAVSKTRSLNSIYNPKVTNATMIRRSWDQDLRRKRVHRLPPLKRKRKHDDMPELTIDPRLPTGPSHARLAIDYNYDHASTTQGRTTSNGYATASSRRSSKALVPLDHHRNFPDLELPAETPRSQRPVQQEWYDEISKSRLTHRTDMEHMTSRSFRNSIDSLHQGNTPRELATFRSSTRNSQNSVISSTMLDPSIRTNRATDIRLARDMDEHHQHSHTPSQSMPIEIRGFQLEGTQLSVTENATIRPLSNINYGASERVKSRRVYPWSSLHAHGTSSRNSSLVPIAEFRRPSLETTITEAQQLIHEE